MYVYRVCESAGGCGNLCMDVSLGVSVALTVCRCMCGSVCGCGCGEFGCACSSGCGYGANAVWVGVCGSGGVREDLSELLCVWVRMCLCVWECVHVGVGVLTTSTEEKQPLVAGLFQVTDCFQNRKWWPGCRLLPAGRRAKRGCWEGGRPASGPAGTPDPPYCGAHLPGQAS